MIETSIEICRVFFEGLFSALPHETAIENICCRAKTLSSHEKNLRSANSRDAFAWNMLLLCCKFLLIFILCSPEMQWSSKKAKLVSKLIKFCQYVISNTHNILGAGLTCSFEINLCSSASSCSIPNWQQI